MALYRAHIVGQPAKELSMDFADLLRAAAPLGGGVAIVVSLLAALVGVVRSRYRAQIEAIRRAPPEAIPKLLGDEVDKMGLSVARLTKDQQYALALRALEQRETRSKRLFQFSLVAAIAFVLLALAGFLAQARSGSDRDGGTGAGDSTAIPAREVAADLTASVLQDRLGSMILGFKGLANGETRSVELPNFVDPASAARLKARLSTGPFSVESGGVVDGKGRFAVVARSGHWVVERLYVHVKGFADCNLRDETTTAQAPAVRWSYAFWLNKQFSKYDLVPLGTPGSEELWRYDSASSDEIGIRFYAEPYTLYLISLVAEARDESNGSQRFATESPIFPVLFVKGNTDGCLNLGSWYSPSKLRQPLRQDFRALFNNALAYQFAVLDAPNSQSFLTRAVTLSRPLVESATTELSAISAQREDNKVLRRNADVVAGLLK